MLTNVINFFLLKTLESNTKLTININRIMNEKYNVYLVSDSRERRWTEYFYHCSHNLKILNMKRRNSFCKELNNKLTK